MTRTVLGILFLLLALSARAQDFVIQSFHSDITVNRDASINIREIITVVFSQPKRGIFRTVPYRYKVLSGPDRFAQVSEFTASYDNGFDPGLALTDDNYSKTLRLGQADKFLEVGKPYTYIITYKVNRAFNWFDQNKTWQPWAELYWNITGNDWQAPIQKASTTITFPPSEDTTPLRARLYHGPTGSNNHLEVFGQNGTRTSDSALYLKNGKLFAEVNQTLPAGNGMTVVLAMSPESVPKQTYPDPSVLQNYQDYDAYTFGFPKVPGYDPVGFFIPIPVFVILFFMWLLVGKDPKFGPPPTQFEPPDNLGPAECGLLLDGRVDPRDITAAIVNLAVKGYLKFVSEDQQGRFKIDACRIEFTQKKVGDDLSGSEKVLLNQLGPEYGFFHITSLANVVGPGLKVYIARLKSDLRLAGYLRQNAEDIVGTTLTTGLVLLTVVALIGLGFSPYSGGFTSYLIGIGLSIPILAFFAYLMPRRTRAGALAHHQVVGFRKAMTGRDQYMEWFSQTNLDQAKYEQYLPYAIAFGLTGTWSDIGAKVLDHTPEWVSMPFDADTNFDSYIFQSSLFEATDFMANNEIATYREPVDHGDSWWNTPGGGDGGSDNNSFWGGGSGFGGGGGYSGGSFGGGGFSGGGGGGGYSGGGGGGGGGGSW